MAEFATMNSDDQSIPFNGSSTDENALGLTNPDSVLSGTNRGQQRINSTNGSYMLLGLQNNNVDFGIGFYDRTGSLISKNLGPTQYVYDKTTGKNVIQIGLLPDSTYGFAVAAPGYNVADGFS